MGRPSKLTANQWEELGKRLVAGEKAADLSREYKVSKTAISARFSKRIETVKTVANQLVGAEIALRALPVSEQVQALNLADELRAISMHSASAAKYGMATAHRLSALAHSEVAKVDDADPLASMEALRGVAALTKIANDSAHIGLNLLAANKDAAKQAQAANVPTGLGHFYGEDG